MKDKNLKFQFINFDFNFFTIVIRAFKILLQSLLICRKAWDSSLLCIKLGTTQSNNVLNKAKCKSSPRPRAKKY